MYNINFNFCAEAACPKRENFMLALTINCSDIYPKVDWLISGGDGYSLPNQENFTKQNFCCLNYSSIPVQSLVLLSSEKFLLAALKN